MKRILAIVLSIAILVMAFPFGVFAAEPTVATDTWDGTAVEPTSIDAEGNIIINTAEELAWVALVGGPKTNGVNYKVAANSVFDLNGMSGITLDSTVADVKAVGDPKASAYDRTYAWQTEEDKADATYAFAGNFDGNGLIVYNLFTSKGRGAGGLFPVLFPNSGNSVTIKNVTVISSHIGGYHYAGGIVGFANAPDSSTKLTLEKCVVKNSYIYDNNDLNTACQRTTGTLVGNLLHTSTTINNCLVINNELSAQGIIGGLFGNTSQWGDPNKVTNVVSIGTTVEATSVNYAIKSKTITYSNVYTDKTASANGITTLTADKMQGEAAKTNMALAWNIDWLVGAEGEYPSINFGEPIRDPYVWDGTFKEPTETDAEGNIIINTVQEMAWIALRGDVATEGKSYKVADGVEYFDMNGSVGITADSTAEDVKAATATGNNWNYASDGRVGAFRGNFDGNGVTIFNIRTAKFGHSALFPYVLNESIIENVSIKASYFTGYHTASGIVGTGELQKTIAFNKCVVENCYFTDSGDTNAACSRAAAGIIASTGNSNAKISNCLVVNNIFSAAGYEAGFVAKTGNYAPTGVEITNSIAIGITPYSSAKIGELGKGLTEQLTVTNVYSDVACDVAGYTTLTTDKMQGAAAKDNMALAWNTDWLTGEEGEYPYINYGAPVVDPYVWDGNFVEPTETDSEGNIIINTASEMAWVALRGDAATAGKNYKVADGIEYFDMNGSVGIKADSTADDVKSSTSTGKIWGYAADNRVGAFQGNFDGNGVTIYNIRTTKFAYGALFPYIYNESTIQNVSVKASYISGYHAAGGIVGTGELQKTITVSKCSVENCYITDNNSQNAACTRAVAGIIAATGNSNAKISNCLVANNIFSAAGYEAGFVAKTGNYVPTGIEISNSVAIGITPYSNAKIGELGKGLTEQLTVTNVYSDVACDVAGYIILTSDQMTGSLASVKMGNLDNSIWFFNTTTYPQLRVFHNIVDGKCDCGLEVAGDPCSAGHTLSTIEGYEATNYSDGLLTHEKCSVCDKTFVDGVEKTASELIIPSLAEIWDGTFVEPTTTDANGNIIINTAEELAWVALRGGDATAGKNYKVAKDSVFNLNGMVGITAFSTAADVETATTTGKYWSLAADSSRPAFQGNFDGNGLIVYNMATVKYGYAGLFPVILPAKNSTLTIKNVSVYASNIRAYHTAGAIVGLADAPDTSTSFVLENSVVKNCYISDGGDQNSACQRTVGTLVGNLGHNASTINNCFVIGNELSAQGIIGGLFGNTSAYSTGVVVKNTISIGNDVQPIMVNNVINAKAASATYINVYTDKLASATGITTLTIEQMQGAAAADNMNLNWGINWAVGAEGEYPTLIIDNAFYDEWDGSFVEPTTTDADGNIIINSAEELAWVALRGGEATSGKNYKIADGIKYLNLSGMTGITADSTVDDVKVATKSTIYLWQFAQDNQSAAFKGNFDGNGAIVYNLYSGAARGYAGLFPVTRPIDDGELTVKNIAVVASYIGGYHNAGGIIGNANCNNSNTKLFVENCMVKNCYIFDNNDANTACQRTVGTIVGNIAHNTTTINNCFVAGNELSAQGIVGGLYGNSSAYAGPISVSNVISIGNNIESVSLNYAISGKVLETVYTNVYTDQATTLEGVVTITLDELNGATADTLALDWANGWIATATLPELRAFHDIIIVDNGDGTHTESCDECGISNTASHIAGDEVEENRKGSSCDEEGSYDLVVYCTICDSEISRRTITVPTTEHTPADPVEENRVDATCDVDGSYDSVVYCSACGEELSRVTNTIKATGHNYVKTEIGGGSTSATISFADKANRTDFNDNVQIWVQNGIKVTNNKAASTSKVADYANPARFYKGSETIVEFPGMTKIVIDSSGLDSKYVAWATSFSDSNATASVSGGITTITFATPVDSFTFNSMAAQCRAYSITVYAEGGAAIEKLVCENCGDTRDVPSYGDADNDGEITNRDLAVLMQFINGYDVDVDTVVADVNVDGAVNNKDYVLLMRYINGWYVVLG